jgi:NADH-quinone oxidoreductase subunit J
VLAALTVLAAAGVVSLRNPVHCAMSLVAALFLVAVNYVALRAHLVAALQIIVYAGAVMVLFLFVIMLLNLQAEPARELHVAQKVLGAGAALAVALLLARVFTASSLGAGGAAAAPAGEDAAAFGTTEALARVLFREHVVAFELTSLLLLVAIVGAVVLARRERA